MASKLISVSSVNSFLLILIVLVGFQCWQSYTRLQHHLTTAQDYTASIFDEQPTNEKEQPQHEGGRKFGGPAAAAAAAEARKKKVSQFIAQVMEEVFFFGCNTGSVATFAKNIFQSDFKSLGNAVAQTAADLRSKFQQKGGQLPSCYQPLHCQFSGWVQCPAPSQKLVFCPDANTTMNCADVSCMYKDVIHITSIVESVAQHVARLLPIQSLEKEEKGAKKNSQKEEKEQEKILPSSFISNGSTPSCSSAAFSDGVFQLSSVLHWVKRQAAEQDWKNSGEMCNSFLAQVLAINWEIQYVNVESQYTFYDANKDVQRIVDSVSQVCTVLSKLSSV